MLRKLGRDQRFALDELATAQRDQYAVLLVEAEPLARDETHLLAHQQRARDHADRNRELNEDERFAQPQSAAALISAYERGEGHEGGQINGRVEPGRDADQEAECEHGEAKQRPAEEVERQRLAEQRTHGGQREQHFDENHAEHRGKQREQHGFAQELRDQRGAPGAEDFAQADRARALRGAGGREVHVVDARHAQDERRDSRERIEIDAIAMRQVVLELGAEVDVGERLEPVPRLDARRLEGSLHVLFVERLAQPGVLARVGAVREHDVGELEIPEVE